MRGPEFKIKRVKCAPCIGRRPVGASEEFDVDDVPLHVAGRADRMEIRRPYDVAFHLEYDDNRAGLLQLYAKGKQQQWDAAERIDWSQDLDPENRCCSTTGWSRSTAPTSGTG